MFCLKIFVPRCFLRRLKKSDLLLVERMRLHSDFPGIIPEVLFFVCSISRAHRFTENMLYSKSSLAKAASLSAGTSSFASKPSVEHNGRDSIIRPRDFRLLA